MKFIVYNSIARAYFVSYKDKGSDYYSVRWFEAKKYSTILPALSRLGIVLHKNMKSIDDFYKENPLDKSVKRNEVLSEILNEIPESSLAFIKGHIEAVDDEGNRQNAKDYILNYVENYISKNINRKDNSKKYPNTYINNEITDDEFFEF